ncbi:Galactose-specific lectin nattectin [Holothuria leucospilota]|uniref:Galactose-specific lectin nattectin n=1 Tax=Holothuria leucospilota TaxID=206669 RepID=A0A9Q1BMC6_HOLLE|nr:Galactose-specific lectin nattectin [Holothuria leucospilota]
MVKIVFFILAATFVVGIESGCPPFYTEYNGKCYRYRGSPALNWRDAEAQCVSEGGNLASIHSSDEQDFLHELWRTSRDENTNLDIYPFFRGVSKAPFCYIGLNDVAKTGQLTWSDGTPYDYSNFMRANPTGGNEDGVMMWDRLGLGKWNDVISKSKALVGSYICQVPQSP